MGIGELIEKVNEILKILESVKTGESKEILTKICQKIILVHQDYMKARSQKTELGTGKLNELGVIAIQQLRSLVKDLLQVGILTDIENLGIENYTKLNKLLLSVKLVNWKEIVSEKEKQLDFEMLALSMNRAGRQASGETNYARIQQMGFFEMGGKSGNVLLTRFPNYKSIKNKDMASLGLLKDKLESVFTFEDIPERKPSESRKRKLKEAKIRILIDDILIHKNAYVKRLVDLTIKTQNQTSCFIVDQNQLKAEYPCLIILFANELIEYKKKFGGIEKNFLYELPVAIKHLFAAFVNRECFLNGCNEMVEVRQSFGFLTPTVDDVETGIRLSLGIIRDQRFVLFVSNALLRLNQLFFESKEESWTALFSLFTKTLKIGRNLGYQLIFNIDSVKTITSLDVLTKELIEVLKTAENVTFKPNKYESLETLIKFYAQVVPDKEGCQLYERCRESVYQGLTNIRGYEGDELVKKVSLQTLQQKIIVESKQEHYSALEIEDSSDDDDDTPQFLTPTGMSALIVPMFVYYQNTVHKTPVACYCYPYSYYEIVETLNKAIDHKLIYMSEKADAEIVQIDLTPCINSLEPMLNPYPWQDTAFVKLQMIILDTTSSTSIKIAEYLKAFHQQDSVAMLVTAMSELKHLQLGIDGWQIGSNKIYVSKAWLEKQKTETEMGGFYNRMRAFTRGTASLYAKMMRRALRDKITW